MAQVSLIIAIYNAAKTLEDCLDSVLKQSFKEWECILVNDGSTDDSPSIIDKYGRLDERFVCLSKKNEGSPAKARQFALSRVKAPFVSSIDADDLICPDSLETLVMRQNETGADVIVPTLRCFDGEISHVKWELPRDSFDKEMVVNGRDACLLTMPEWVIGFNGALIRKDLMVSTSSGKWMNSDELKTREILLNSRSVAFSDAVYYYRSNPESITKVISPRIFDKTIVEGQIVRFAEKHFPENAALIEKLRRRHFSGLQYNIVLLEKEKNRFTQEEQEAIERVLSESYHSIKVLPLLKSSFKWGVAVALLRGYKGYKRLVLHHFKSSITDF